MIAASGTLGEAVHGYEGEWWGGWGGVVSGFEAG